MGDDCRRIRQIAEIGSVDYCLPIEIDANSLKIQPGS